MIVELKISFNPATNEVAFSGPLENKLLCYGLLEMARDAVKSFGEKTVAQRGLQVVGAMPEIQAAGGR